MSLYGRSSDRHGRREERSPKDRRRSSVIRCATLSTRLRKDLIPFTFSGVTSVQRLRGLFGLGGWKSDREGGGRNGTAPKMSHLDSSSVPFLLFRAVLSVIETSLFARNANRNGGMRDRTEYGTGWCQGGACGVASTLATCHTFRHTLLLRCARHRTRRGSHT